MLIGRNLADEVAIGVNVHGNVAISPDSETVFLSKKPCLRKHPPSLACVCV